MTDARTAALKSHLTCRINWKRRALKAEARTVAAESLLGEAQSWIGIAIRDHADLHGALDLRDRIKAALPKSTPGGLTDATRA